MFDISLITHFSQIQTANINYLRSHNKMSPISPISPISPMDLSPISPAEAAMLLNIPTTPVLSPAVYLPRLRTSFHMASSGTDTARRLSIQFQLPTPSPLSLGRTPSIGAQTPKSVQHYGGDDLDRDSMYWATSPTSTSCLTSTSRQPPRRGLDQFDTPVVHRKVPSLVRQNANEGLERLQSEASSSLPLRVNTHLPTSGTQISPRRYSAATEQPATQPSRSPSKAHNITLSSSRRSRSPIRKSTAQRKCNHNRRGLTRSTKSTTTPAPKLIIREPPTPRTAAREVDLKSRLSHLSRRLVPLVSVTTGLPHPEFPTNLLRFQLLTHDQLDALARWYHQFEDGVEDPTREGLRWKYPCPLGIGKTWCGVGRDGDVEMVVELETKRRRWGRFIGLQGCESPVEDGEESVEEMEARLEREWREALRRAREADKVREKLWRGRF